jgi:molybdate transport repressor ModE-like protein
MTKSWPQSASRRLAILKAIADAPQGTSHRAIAREVGIPVMGVWHHVNMMKGEGLIAGQSTNRPQGTIVLTQEGRRMVQEFRER